MHVDDDDLTEVPWFLRPVSVLFSTVHHLREAMLKGVVCGASRRGWHESVRIDAGLGDTKLSSI